MQAGKKRKKSLWKSIRRSWKSLWIRIVRCLKRRPSHQRLGILGENLACRALEEIGLDILARNFRSRFGEIDIVARDGETLCIVEVKTRHRMRFGRPADAVDGSRRIRQIRAGESISRQIFQDEKPHCRYDIMEVIFDGSHLAEMNYIRHAYGKTVRRPDMF